MWLKTKSTGSKSAAGAPTFFARLNLGDAVLAVGNHLHAMQTAVAEVGPIQLDRGRSYELWFEIAVRQVRLAEDELLTHRADRAEVGPI